MRLILFTGKGGVGKTTVAASSALRAAELGYKTIILSTDSAHSLSDSFDIALGGEPQPIAPNLWGQETDMSQTIQSYWGTIQEWLTALLTWRGMDEIVADEMAIVPGMEELANLLYIVSYYDSGDWDVIIVDCAPTGETLRFLSFPEIMRWWMERMFPIGKAAAAISRPIMKRILGIPMPGDKVFQSVEELFEQLNRMHTIFTDPEISSMRLVVNPEKMVIKEAQRTFTYLNLYGYFTDLVILNRIIPDSVDDPYFDFWKRSQKRYREMVEERFSPIPILTAPLMEEEVVGTRMLKAMGKTIYQDDDPVKIFFHGQPHNIEMEDGYYVLSLDLPFIAKEEISLLRNGDELTIQVGSYRRNIILPRALLGLKVKEAKFEERRLRIRFEDTGSV